MIRHRFRTAVLIGEWRPTRRQACDDALRARQAHGDARAPDRMIWAVPGVIESDCGPGSSEEPRPVFHRSF